MPEVDVQPNENPAAAAGGGPPPPPSPTPPCGCPHTGDGSSPAAGDTPAAANVPEPLQGHAIIAGFGLAGRAVAEGMKSRGIRFCVIELNADTVRRCARIGTCIFHGDATKEPVLRQAGIERAILFAATMPKDAAVIEAVAQARKINPKVRIMARLDYLSNGIKATKRGADDVVIAERVVAQEFIRLVEADFPASAASPTPAAGT